MCWRLFGSAIWFVLAAVSAQAEVRALLVGVSDYDSSIGLSDLDGPANDVSLLREVLADRGATDITILADGVAGGALPTRNAILSAFGDMAIRAQPGDLVYVHLSGHGTRQPDRDGDETDGLDEVFLPSDTGRAEPGSNAIPNALIDDEIGRAVTAIRQTGADVWLVMDSCHSGSGLRAAPIGTRARYIDPSALGIDSSASKLGEAGVVEATGPEPPGAFLAFYAARSSEVAREVSFEQEDGSPAWYGLFSAKLAARLQDAGALSYRQLFQAVLSDMNDSAVPGGARLQTPLWEGSLIDATVFGGEETAGLRRFAVQNGKLQAGKIHGVSDGTLLGLVDDAAAAPDAVVGYAQTTKTAATTAALVPVDDSCVPRLSEPCAAAGTLPDEARYAQILARPVDLIVRFASPRDGLRGENLETGRPEMVALQTALARFDGPGGASMVLDPDAYDIEVVLHDGAFWFGQAAHIGDSPVGLAVPPDPDALHAALTRIRRAEEMSRLLTSVVSKPSLLSPNPIAVSVEANAVNAADLEPADAGVPPFEECQSAIGASQSGSRALDPGTDLKQCDQLAISAQGTVPGARDVNRIHIDAKFCIHAAHERIEGTAQPRPVGDGMILCSDCPDGYSAGVERLFVVVTEAKDNMEILNMEGLVENCGGAMGATRGAAQQDLTDFLTDLSERPDTRGAFGGTRVADVWVERFDWRVLPKPEVFARAGLAVADN